MADVQSELQEFANAITVPQLVDAGRPLLKTSAAAQAAKSDKFQDGLTSLIDHFGTANGEAQIHAIAFAWRLTSVMSMRRHRLHLIERLREPSPEPTVSSMALSDPDDRKNLAEALRWKEDDWVIPYLVQSISLEKDGKQARMASCQSLLIKQVNLVWALTALGTGLRNSELGQKDQNTGRVRQMINILVSLGEASWNDPDNVELGDEFGPAYARLIGSIVSAGKNTDRSLVVLLAQSAVEFYVRLGRLNPTLTAQSDSYQFIRSVKRLFGQADWPEEMSSCLDSLAKLAGQQLVFLLQIGKPDRDLRSLILFLKGEASGNRYLDRLAKNAESLSEDDRYWLEHGQGRKQGATERAIGDSALANFDRDLGYLYRAVDALGDSAEATKRAFENEAELIPEATVDRMSRFFERTEIINRRAMDLFSRRRLSVKGRIGEIVQFDPNEHDPSAEAIGEKTVRIMTKIVERQLNENRSVIVIKADVEKP